MRKILNVFIILVFSFILISCGNESSESEPIVPTQSEPTPHQHSTDEKAKYDGAKHWYVCDCGEIFNEKDHTFTEEVIRTSTCSTSGSKVLTCECGYERTETIELDPLVHEPDAKYTYDEEKHWQVCECGVNVDEVEHSFDELTTSLPTCS